MYGNIPKACSILVRAGETARTSLRERQRPVGSAEDSYLKKSACNLVAQLPDNPEDAMKVLGYAARILDLLSDDSVRSVDRTHLLKAIAPKDAQVVRLDFPDKSSQA